LVLCDTQKTNNWSRKSARPTSEKTEETQIHVGPDLKRRGRGDRNEIRRGIVRINGSTWKVRRSGARSGIKNRQHGCTLEEFANRVRIHGAHTFS